MSKTPLFDELRPAMQVLVKDAVIDAIDFLNDMSLEDINCLTPEDVKAQALIMFGLALTPDGPLYYVPDYLIPLVSQYVDVKLMFKLEQ
jgi:hypothetical protein